MNVFQLCKNCDYFYLRDTSVHINVPIIHVLLIKELKNPNGI